jgi:REP element-mobilizing transposase RayT
MPEAKRKSLRLGGYDYATPGAYFVTVCAYRKQMLFEDEAVTEIIRDSWTSLPDRFTGVSLDEFAVMPNHLHCIVWLGVGAPLAGARGGGVGARPTATGKASPQTESQRPRAGASPAPTLGDVVGAFKSTSSVEWLRWVKANDPNRSAKLWQRNYYERVIRNEDELRLTREYIRNNPLKWRLDHENPNHLEDLSYDRDWGWLEGIAVA